MEQNRQVKENQQQQMVVVNGAQYEDEVEIDLAELFFTLLHNWKLLLAAGILGMVILACYHGLFVRSTYKATPEMYISNTDSVISLQDLQLGSALTEDYKNIITSRAVLNQVISDLQLDMDYKALLKLIDVSNPTGTHIISTSVTSTDKDASRVIANDLLNVSIDRIYQIIGTSEPTIINYSEADAIENVTPGLLKYMVIGGFVFFLLAAAFIVIRMLMDTTLKSDDDVEKYLKLPVLAGVPYYNEDK